MKKHVFLLLMVTLFSLSALAVPERIILRDGGSKPTRDDYPLYFDIPDVFYDNNPKNQVIIIDGGGTVSYYDVEITSGVTGYVEISTQVNGIYDSFDVSSLTTGVHIITIESPSGYIYEGNFTIY